MKLRVKIKKLHEGAVVPSYAHPGDSGADLHIVEEVTLPALSTSVLPTGIALEIPPGHEAQVRPRSGITSKTFLRVQLGTVDQKYTGEIGIIVDNLSPEPVTLEAGFKLAQLIFAPVESAHFVVTDELAETVRGSSGFGSTGV